MKKMGVLERLIRLAAGIGFYSLGFVLKDGWQYLAVIGPCLILTSLAGISLIGVINWFRARHEE